METETLSSYEQPQDKHILENNIDVDIPNHEEDSNSVHSNENNETDVDVSMKSANSEHSGRKDDTEQNCDETDFSSKSKTHCDNLEENSHDKNLSGDSVLNLSVEDDESKADSDSDEEQDETSITKDPLTEENHNTENGDKNDPIELEENKSDEKEENKSDEKEKTTGNEADLEQAADTGDKTDNEVKDAEKVGKTDNDVNDTDIAGKPDNDVNDTDNDGKTDTEVKDMDDADKIDNEVKDTDSGDKTNEEVNATDNDGKIGNEDKEFPLLKETLTKRKDDDVQEIEESENGDDLDMDEDFDPSLLCPDIAMEVEEAPVITNTDIVPNDGSKSPLLYEPMFSTYVDEMTGAEVSFDLTADEQRLRQEMYGDNNPIQFTKVHCSACNVHLGSALDGQSNRFVHPLLKVLICKNCYHFYTSGEFEKDEDGSELYCRWCGQGGQVMCCSSCEMVFCKKCIRINFGRKKLTEIRDSDDWFCFRCNPSQLTELRVHCAEFMEYVRREISRAATLENSAAFMTTDYTQCCVVQKKKCSEPHTSEPRKKRKKSVDPDYDPVKDLPPKIDSVVEIHSSSPTVPKLLNSATAGVIVQAATTGTVYKVGNTTFRPRSMQLNQIRPTLTQGNVITTGVRAPSSGPGYIKIMPSGLRVARATAPTFTSTAMRHQSNFNPRHVRPMAPNDGNMKHEWFEKTVRAAARVNSNLSYTLTQLNRAQATATSVEALAVVHNKLQEILSTSINSLIQIRKNLRTEFIAGIKNIKFPPKPMPQLRPMPSTSSQDDDVIFVSPSSSPVPPPLIASNPSIISPGVTLCSATNAPKRINDIVPTTTLQPIPSTSTFSNGNKPKSFLRVKSLSALQCVPSECITIPDDPIPPPELPPLTPISPVTSRTSGSSQKDLLKENVANGVKESDGHKSETDEVVIIDEKDDKVEDTNTEKANVSNNNNILKCSTWNLKDLPTTDEVKKMFNVKIHLQRSEEIDKLVRLKFANGDTCNTETVD